jgi:hypothetical protein
MTIANLDPCRDSKQSIADNTEALKSQKHGNVSSKRLSPILQVAPDAVLAFAPWCYDILCPSDAEDARGLRKRNVVEVRVTGTNVLLPRCSNAGDPKKFFNAETRCDVCSTQCFLYNSHIV